jgi:hypothetical protein
VESTALQPATHAEEHAYWDGGNYELNMSFESLRDKQWERVMQTVWTHHLIYGPLTTRYVPGAAVTRTSIIIPQPTATQAQHGQIEINAIAYGCNVLATRSLFECVSVLVPLGMFAGITLREGESLRRANPQLETLDNLLYEIALAVYEIAPFQVAAIGWERECQVVGELRTDANLRHQFFGEGNFLAREDVLRGLGLRVDTYTLVRPGLYWAPLGN